jgi:hypothetical protein
MGLMTDRHVLLSVTPLEPEIPGHVRVLLACSCGKNTDFTYPAGSSREAGRSYTCSRCQTGHWFTITG